MKRLTLGVAIFLFACGGPPAEPEAPPPAPKPMPEPNRPTVASSAASDALTVLPPDSNLVIRLQLDRVRQGHAMKTVAGLSKEIAEARQGLTIVKAACGVDPTEEIGEIALGARASIAPGGVQLDPREATLAIELAEPERAISCLQNFLPVSQADVAGAPALVLPNGSHIQARDNLLLYATAPALEAAQTRLQHSAPLAPGVRGVLDAHPGAILAAYTNAPNPYELEWASVTADDSEGDVKLEALGVAKSKEAADKAAAFFAQTLERAKRELEALGSEGAELKGLLDRVRVEVADKSVAARLTIPEKDAERFFSEVLVGAIAQGSRRYALLARTAEARDLLMQIALKLSDYAQAHRMRFPASAPLSPEKVPQRAPVLPAPHFEHPSWKAIGFAPREPIFFSYEFVTAKHGLSVEVIARGDLDADGETSKYSITVRNEKGRIEIGEKIVEENPLE